MADHEARTGRAPDEELDVTLQWPAGAEEPTAMLDDSSTRGAADDDLDAAEVLPAVPLLPSIAGRVEALDGQLRAIGIRLDVLGAAVASLRSSIGDRVDAYAEAAAATARQADDALEEHRRATQRSTTELKTATTQYEDALRHLAVRVDELADDVLGALAGLGGAAAPAGVDDALARLEERVEHVAAIAAAVLDGLESGEPDAPGAPPEVDLSAVEAALTEVLERLDALPAPPDMRPLASAIAAALEDLGDRIDAGLTAIEVPPPAPSAPSTPPAAFAAATDLAPIERSLDELRGLVEVVVDTMPASADGTGDDLAARVAEQVVARLDLDAIATAVVTLLEKRFEVISEGDAG